MSYEFTGIPPRSVEVEIGGVLFRAQTGKQVFQQYRAAVEAAGGRVEPGWEDVVFGAIMEKYPRYVRKLKQKSSGGLSLASAKSYLKFVLKGGLSAPLVSEEEAMRRMSICTSCPMSQSINACPFCKLALKSVKIPKELDGPMGCGACGCYLKAKVWIDRELLGSEGDFPYDATCWMREQPVAGDAYTRA